MTYGVFLCVSGIDQQDLFTLLQTTGQLRRGHSSNVRIAIPNLFLEMTPFRSLGTTGEANTKQVAEQGDSPERKVKASQPTD